MMLADLPYVEQEDAYIVAAAQQNGPGAGRSGQLQKFELLRVFAR